MKYDYELEMKNKDLRKQNIKITQKSLSESWLKIKIKNFSEKWGFSYKKVENEIKDNKIVAASFAKDPSKQNFYQTQALFFLNSMEFVERAEQLPSSGSNSIFIVDGKLLKGSEILEKKNHKSIDFKITLKNRRIIFASHKYTKESGGAQDNQRNDLINFVFEAEKYPNNDFIFALIADGEYYKKDKTWIEFVKNKADSKVRILTMENFEDEIKNYDK